MPRVSDNFELFKGSEDTWFLFAVFDVFFGQLSVLISVLGVLYVSFGLTWFLFGVLGVLFISPYRALCGKKYASLKKQPLVVTNIRHEQKMQNHLNTESIRKHKKRKASRA